MLKKPIHYYLQALKYKKENKLNLAIECLNKSSFYNFAPAYIELSKIEENLFNFYTKKAAEAGNTISQAYYGEYLLSNELYFHIENGKLEKGYYDENEKDAKLIKISDDNFPSDTQFILAIDSNSFFDGNLINYKLSCCHNAEDAQTVFYDGTQIYFYKENIKYYLDFYISKENVDSAYLTLKTKKDKTTITTISGNRIRFIKSYDYFYEIAKPFLKQAFSQCYDTMLTVDDQIPLWACENYSEIYYNQLIECKKLVVIKRKRKKKSEELMLKADNFLNNNNYVQAISYYKKSAKLSNSKAMLKIAYYYMGLLDNNVETDYRLAYEYIKLAAELDDNDAKFTLAICHLFGIGTVPNKIKGRELLLKLKDINYPYSQELLNTLILY